MLFAGGGTFWAGREKQQISWKKYLLRVLRYCINDTKRRQEKQYIIGWIAKSVLTNTSKSDMSKKQLHR